MKKYRITVTAETDEQTFKEMKDMILNGEFQRDVKKDDRVKNIKATIEELK